MSKGFSGHFSGTKGSKAGLNHSSASKNSNKASEETARTKESTINKDKQKRHLESEAKDSGRSYIYGDGDKAQELVDKYSGKGYSPKENMEIVSTDEIVGVYKDNLGDSMESDVIVIVKSKTGAHVYPGKPKKGNK